MLYFLIICSALAPAIILGWLIVKRDPSSPEPISWLLKSAGLGVVAAILTTIAVAPFMGELDKTTFLGAVVEAFCGAAIPEESFKLLMLYIVAKRCRAFDEPYDGIIYAVCISMGFAGFENILYLLDAGGGWFTIGIMRALLSVPGHCCFAIIMGAFFSLAWFDNVNRGRYALLALIAPILAHGIYDSLLFLTPVVEWGSPLIIAAFIYFFRRMCRYAKNLVSKHVAIDALEAQKRIEQDPI